MSHSINWKIETYFEKSPSINFKKALKLLKKNPSYCFDNETYSAKYTMNNLLEFDQIFILICDWKSTHFRIGEMHLGSRDIWPFYSCMGERIHSSKDTCFGGDGSTSPENSLGCHFAGAGWSDDWYKSGIMDTNGVWNFEKGYYLSILKDRLYRFRFCPFMNLEKMAKIIDALPTKIDPRVDKEWEYTFRSEKGLIVKGVQPKKIHYASPFVFNYDEKSCALRFSSLFPEEKQNK